MFCSTPWRSAVAGLVLIGSLAGPVLAQPSTPEDLYIPVTTPATPGQLLLLRAEQISRDGNIYTCVGKVRVEYQGLQIDCQWLRYDLDTGKVEARKECLFSFGDSFIAADEIDYLPALREANLKRVVGRGSSLSNGTSSVEKPIFFWAEDMVWKPDLMELHQATVTTCDEQPGRWDYRIVAERVEIYPGEKIEAYRSAVEFDGFRPVTLPRLTFSLDPSKPLIQEYLPTVGYSGIYGGYIQFAIPYSLDRHNLGKIHIDYYTRTGFSGGIEHNFNWDDRVIGDVYYYQQPGTSSRASRLDLRANVAAKIDDDTTAAFSYSQNRFELPNFVSPRTVATQFSLVHNTEDTYARFQANYARSGDSTNTFYSGALRHNFDERTQLFLGADHTQAAFLNSRGDRFHYNASLRHHQDLFDVEAASEATYGQKTFFVNREPELRFVAKPVYLGEVPLLASASFARITESPSQFTNNRWDFRLALPDQMYSLGSSRFVVGAGLRQFFYENGDQQRVAQARASWFQPLGDSMTARVDFNLQHPTGQTPFKHDFTTPYRVLTGGLEYYNAGSLRLGAYGGYDFLRKRPSDLIARLDYQAGAGFGLSSGANFDPNRGRFRTIDNQLSLRLGDNISLSHWSVYDFQRARLTYQDFAVNFESHDWIATVAYRGLQQEVFVQLNLKNFPTRPLHIGPETGLPTLPNPTNNPFVNQGYSY